jgi:NhaA family Na+:H+ antiporter
MLNRLRVSHVAAYVIVGAILWVCVLKSGVHATLAGPITAFAIPLRVRDEDGHSLLRHLEHTLHPWVAFLVLPTFAFANAGVSDLGFGDLLEPVTLGIVLGLFIGKQVGVFVPLWLCIRLGLASMPADEETHGRARGSTGRLRSCRGRRLRRFTLRGTCGNSCAAAVTARAM